MDPTASLFCCGRSPRNSYRRLSLRSTRRSVWGIDLSSLRTDEDFLQVLTSVLTSDRARRDHAPPKAHRSLSGSMPGYARAAASHG
jgi:hypothetical protein